MIRVALAVLGLIAGAAASAGTGALDPTFGTGGKVVVNLDRSSMQAPDLRARAVFIQPDGRIVSAGTATVQSQPTVVVTRHNADGTPDTSFSGSGRAMLLGTSAWAYAAALQPDGQIVVGGVIIIPPAGYQPFVARFHADGSPDTTFNATARSLGVLGLGLVRAVAIQADGRIVVAGSRGNDILVARLNTDGTFDLTFNNPGAFNFPAGTAAKAPFEGLAAAIALQPDGRILVAGLASLSPDPNAFALVRYNANGTLDTTFNGTGGVTTTIGSGSFGWKSLALQPDGRIVVAGAGYKSGGEDDFVLARYLSTGALDPAFNATGFVVTSFTPSSDERLRAMALQPDGKIVTAGWMNLADRAGALARHNADGTLDATFNGAGTRTDAIGPPCEFSAVAVEPGGAIIAAGRTDSRGRFLLARYLGNGTPDTTFGTGGSVATVVSFSGDTLNDLVVLADGRIVAAGSSGEGTEAIARFLANGSLDPAFGEGGVIPGLSPGDGGTGNARALAIQSDGQIVAVGSSDYPGGVRLPDYSLPTISRYSGAGFRDNGFTAGFGEGQFLVASDVLLQPDGRIVTIGSGRQGWFVDPPAIRDSFELVRHDAAGALDPSFNGTGRVTTTIGGGIRSTAGALQPDGKIVIVGTNSAYSVSPYDAVLVRYSAAGAVDGQHSFRISATGANVPRAVAIQADARILVAGEAGTQGFVARFMAPGVFDPTFATGGVFAPEGAPIVAIALLADGRILALTESFHLWQLSPDGAPAGLIAIRMGDGAKATAMGVMADGRVVVGGSVPNGPSLDFALARVDPAGSGPLTAAPPVVDFGGQSMNTTSPTRAAMVTNVTTGSATVLSVSVVGPFDLVTHDCATLAPGAGCSVVTSFTPTTQGLSPGAVVVETTAGTILVPLAGTGERSLVTHYYRAVLRRAPDAAGKAFWEAEAARVQALGANVNEAWFAMAQSFFSSTEYLALNRSGSEFVSDLYATFFNRAPDAQGLAFWADLFAQGMPREVVLASFMFSTEFRSFTQAIFGTSTVRAEVDVVVDFYRGLLARLPENNGFAYWLAQFRSAQCQGTGAAVNAMAEAISSGFARSAEYTGRNRTNAQYVGDLYNSFLRRGGDLAGVLFWIGRLDTGTLSREAVRQQFVASAEFSARVSAILSQGCAP